jgi:hypothetical protein
MTSIPAVVARPRQRRRQSEWLNLKTERRPKKTLNHTWHPSRKFVGEDADKGRTNNQQPITNNNNV